MIRALLTWIRSIIIIKNIKKKSEIMLKKNFGWTITTCLLLLCACHQKPKENFSINGTFKNADKLASLEGGPISKVYLLEVPYGKDQPPVVLDSTKIEGKSGSFNLATND